MQHSSNECFCVLQTTRATNDDSRKQAHSKRRLYAYDKPGTGSNAPIAGANTRIPNSFKTNIFSNVTGRDIFKHHSKPRGIAFVKTHGTEAH